MAVDVRKPIYGCVARQVIDSKHILSLMARVNWEVKDVVCQHSQYVDVLFNVSTMNPSWKMILVHVSLEIIIDRICNYS